MRAATLIVLVVLAGCADQAVAEPDGNEVVLRASTEGGCAQLGPNCVQIDVFGDATVSAFRILPDGSEQVDTGVIDRELVVALHREVSQADLQALYDRLPPGECRGCYDGIDTTMSFPFTVGVAAVMPMEFSSVEVELDPSEPLFAAAWAVYEAAQAVIEVPVMAR